MAEASCEHCKWRAKYDAKPKSFLGRLWRWHANWCPGWKAYITSLPQERRQDLAKRYNMVKFQ
ncbi:MAG: hypothetical protein C4523_21470 [Myxococcales bacterium]|nr:MAG: hypothetical protein C4523_21470 [Myxococcales bacterium]